MRFWWRKASISSVIYQIEGACWVREYEVREFDSDLHSKHYEIAIIPFRELFVPSWPLAECPNILETESQQIRLLRGSELVNRCSLSVVWEKGIRSVGSLKPTPTSQEGNF